LASGASEMARPKFEIVWRRIGAHAGQTFQTKLGKEFKYQIIDDGFFPEHTNHRVDISDFENSYGNVPCDGPTDMRQGIREPRGASYIWSVLHDRRIRQQDW
jgi:hypothetical protein